MESIKEQILDKTLLYDFYGELLTEYQKRIYEEVVLNDYSISEVAKDEGISRQSVSELIKRCDRILEMYESKLKLVAKFHKTKYIVAQIHTLTNQFKETKDNIYIEQIEKLSRRILEEAM